MYMFIPKSFTLLSGGDGGKPLMSEVQLEINVLIILNVICFPVDFFVAISNIYTSSKDLNDCETPDGFWSCW